MMEYLKQLYAKLFGDGAGGSWEQCVNTPRKVVAFGNALLDRTTQLSDTALLERYELTLGTKCELDAETLSKLAAEACERLNTAANPGGSALNTVRILKELGTEALFFGAVGVDTHAEELKAILKQRGVETRLQTISDAPTGQCLCLLHADNSALYANIGASARFSVEHLRKAEQGETGECEDNGIGTGTFLRPIERKQILYIEGFFVPQRESVCQYIAKHYIRERRRLALNLSAPYIVEQNFEQMLQLAHSAFFIFGNHNEFQALQECMGGVTLEQMADTLLQGGQVVKVIVVTHGSGSVQLITNYVREEENSGGAITFQSYNVPRVADVIDTTGAGDAFVAGFLHAWLEKRALSECVRVASDVAAKVVTQIGCNLPPS